jgi:hypothetical protein
MLPLILHQGNNRHFSRAETTSTKTDVIPNRRRELPRIPFVGTASSLSSRAQQDGPLADHPAESRDPVLAGAQQGPGEEFSARGSAQSTRGKNSPRGRKTTQANTGSFDSANRLASEPVRSTQDDNAGKDADVFRAFVTASPKSTSTTNSSPNTSSRKPRRKAKSSTTA